MLPQCPQRMFAFHAMDGGYVRILLVEDETEMADALSTALRQYDMIVDRASTLAAAEEAVAIGVHDAILLDRHLPDGDGLSFVPTSRKRVGPVPIIILTAKGDLSDRIEGLNGGADDYLAKPFAVEELVARLRAVLRRSAELKSDIIHLGRLSFDLAHCEATVDDRQLELPRRELLVLEKLMRRMGRTVTRASLEVAVYAFNDEIQSNALDAHVSRLRRKLHDANSAVEIHAIRGVGYLMKRSQ
jgi:DNA-binding response OmpR family regulator